MRQRDHQAQLARSALGEKWYADAERRGLRMRLSSATDFDVWHQEREIFSLLLDDSRIGVTSLPAEAEGA